jgi:hypothetical protein
MVQRGSVGIARWLAVRQARVRIPARHPMEATAVKKWRWAPANVYE